MFNIRWLCLLKALESSSRPKTDNMLRNKPMECKSLTNPKCQLRGLAGETGAYCLHMEYKVSGTPLELYMAEASEQWGGCWY